MGAGSACHWSVVCGAWSVDVPKSPLNCYLRVRRVRWHLWPKPSHWHLRRVGVEKEREEREEEREGAAW